MDKDAVIKHIEKTRTEILNYVNLEFDRMIKIYSGASETKSTDEFSIDIPLFSNPSIFKGRKPICVLFEDEEVKTITWKQVAKALLLKCCSNPETHDWLKEICGLVFGKNRLLFGKDDKEMNSPIKINEYMYFETKFDAETMMSVLVDRILKPVGFDCTGIAIRVKML